MDVKGRTSLPARFREQLAARSESSLFVTKGPKHCLWCFPKATFEAFESRILAMGDFSTEARRLRHLFLAPAQECEFDKMGRILVPPTLRAFAGLEADVVWLGLGDKIELWGAARWRELTAGDESLLDEETFLNGIGI